MNTILTDDVLFLLDLLDNRARVVGGAVRDALRGDAVNDIDIATELSPQDVLNRLTKAGICTKTPGIEHGTVMAIINHKPYEITTLRCDTQTDGRHAKVLFTDSYEQDALRRDFTVNALYMDKNGIVYDYTGGKEDLKRKLVRFIGNPSERVQEDYLRILRYFRFWSKLGQGQIDVKSIEACSAYAEKLNVISSERKQYEFFEILSLPSCYKTLEIMLEHGVLQHILSVADLSDLSCFLSVCPQAEIEEKLAILTQGNPINLILSKNQKKLLHSFNQPIQISDDLKEERLRLYKMGQRVYHFHVYRALSQCKITTDLAQALLSLTVPVFPLKGQDFIELGYSSGPKIKQCIQISERIWAENGFSENKELVLNDFLVYNKR